MAQDFANSTEEPVTKNLPEGPTARSDSRASQSKKKAKKVHAKLSRARSPASAELLIALPVLFSTTLSAKYVSTRLTGKEGVSAAANT